MVLNLLENALINSTSKVTNARQIQWTSQNNDIAFDPGIRIFCTQYYQNYIASDTDHACLTRPDGTQIAELIQYLL